jgi:hypothetical protein
LKSFNCAISIVHQLHYSFDAPVRACRGSRKFL